MLRAQERSNKYQFYSHGFTRWRLEPTIYRTRGEHANHYIADTVDTKPIRVRVVVFNATFNNISAISWRSVLLVEKTGVPEEDHRPIASH